MKTIAQLTGVDFLRQCNKIRYGVDAVMKNTKVLDIRKKKPTLTGNETEEEVKKKYDEQARKNVSEMLDVMLDKKPEETMKLLSLLVVLDEGEEEPSGLELLMTGIEVLSDKRVMDFLLSLMQLGDHNTAS